VILFLFDLGTFHNILQWWITSLSLRWQSDTLHTNSQFKTWPLAYPSLWNLGFVNRIFRVNRLTHLEARSIPGHERHHNPFSAGHRANPECTISSKNSHNRGDSYVWGCIGSDSSKSMSDGSFFMLISGTIAHPYRKCKTGFLLFCLLPTAYSLRFVAIAALVRRRLPIERLPSIGTCLWTESPFPEVLWYPCPSSYPINLRIGFPITA